MRKILFITNFGHGKIGNFSRSSYEASMESDMEFHVIANQGSSGVHKTTKDGEAIIHHYDCARSPFSLKNIKAYKQLLELMREENFDMVHCNTPIGGILGRLCAKKAGIPKIIYMAHGFHFYKGAPLKNRIIYKTVERWLAHYTDLIITINREDFEAAKKFKMKKDGKVRLVHGVGVDTNIDEISLEEKKELKSIIKLSDDDIVCIAMGELNENKNYGNMIKAIKEVENPKVKLLICGIGEKMDSLKLLAKELKIEEQIYFLGYRNDVKKLLNISDIFIQLSYREGLSRSVMEAMSYGLPCIISKIRGNVDLIEDGEGGFLCNPSSPKQVAEKLREIIINTELRRKMRDTNIENVKRYNIEFIRKFSIMSIVNICLWLYIFLKPFYFGKSGSLQLSDLFVVLAFFLTLVRRNRKRVISNNTSYVVIFVICVTLINLIYCIICQNTDFIQPIMYYMYILIGVMVFNTKIKEKSFLRITYYLFIVDILVQFILYIVGIGKNWMGTSRYMGTLRDPNQFAFFIFLCMMYVNILGKIFHRRRQFIVYIIGVYLIFLSASTGMLLATTIFAVFSIISNAEYMLRVKKIITSKKTILVFSIIFVALAFIGLNSDNRENASNFINKNIINSSIVKRTKLKFEKSSSANKNLAEDRNIDMLYDNWKYIFTGAGEGDFSRFGSVGEIHSTLPSMLFYYGIIPVVIFLYWVYKNLNGVKFRGLVPYIAIFVESFTLLNQRQLLLWVIIMLAVNIKQNNVDVIEEKSVKEEI